MALILEIRDASGRVAWHRLDGVPLTLGRAPASDVILDDPYVDGRHARVARDEAGAWTITDLGSVNGVYADGRRLDAASPLEAGTELRLGRTVLRIRDTEEDVAPALVDDARAATAQASEPSATPALADVPRAPVKVRRPLVTVLEGTHGRVAVIVAMLVAFAFNEWITDESRSPAGSVMSSLFAISMFVALWSLVWAASTRGADRRFRFVAHVAVAATALLGALVATTAKEWLAFLFPDSSLVAFLYGLSFLALASFVVAAHLGVSGTMSRRRRWRAGLMVSGTVVVLSVLAAIVKDETFSDVAKVDADLKPLLPSLVPTRSVDDFGAVMRKAKRKADEEAKKDADS